MARDAGAAGVAAAACRSLSAHGEPVPPPPKPPEVAAAEDKKAALKEQALADAGVQALLEVFPAEIRDVEEM